MPCWADTRRASASFSYKHPILIPYQIFQVVFYVKKRFNGSFSNHSTAATPSSNMQMQS